MTHDNGIPKVIHYCWFGGSPISELSRHCLETWRAVMPDYTIEAWTETRLDRSIPYIDMAYRQRKFAFVADYVRLKVLYEHGGIYLDTDVEALKPFDQLLDARFFIGLQLPDSVGAGVIGAVKGHRFLKLALEQLDAEAASGTLSFEPLPEMVTRLLATHRFDDALVLPEDYFYPYNPYSSTVLKQKPLQSNISPRTLCIHHWEGTWLGDMSLRMMLRLRLKQTLQKLRPMRLSRPSLPRPRIHRA